MIPGRPSQSLHARTLHFMTFLAAPLLVLSAGCGGGGSGGSSSSQAPAGAGLAPAPVGALGILHPLIVPGDSGMVLRTNGDGAGAFAPLVELQHLGGGVARSAAIADFDGDGILDFVSGGNGNLQLYAGRADGTYAPRVALPAYDAAGYTMDAVEGDWNGDGFMDFISGSNAGTTAFYTGNGAGGFTLVLRDLGPHGRGQDAGDFDRDGKLDFVRARCCDGRVELYRGDGAGNFTAVFIAFVENDPYGVASGDFDNDGLLDLIVGGSGSGNPFFLKGNGNGSFAAPVYVPAADPDNYWGADAYDFDRDGNLDLIQATYTSRRLRWLRGNGAGGFSEVLEIGNFLPDNSLAVAAATSPPPVDIVVLPASQTIPVGGTAELTVSGSGIDGATSISWSFGDGGTAQGQNPTHVYATEGIYQPSVAVTLANGSVHRRSGRVQVSGAPPVARAGGPYSLGEAAASQDRWTATLDGRGSSDEAGIVSHAWSFGDGTSGSGATIAHTWPNRGPWTVTLTVTDAAGQAASESTTVTFTPGGPPVAVLAGPALVDETSARNGVWTAAFNANASTDDAGIWRHEWTFGDGGTATGSSVSHGYSAAGSYRVEVRVFDHANQSSLAFLQVTVKANSLPTPVITGPDRLGESAATAGCWRSSWDSAASTDDVGVWRVEWDFGDGGTSTALAPSHDYCSAGVYTVRLTVHDHGRQTATATRQVVVEAEAAPVARIAASRTTVEGTQPFELSGAPSTDDFGIARYSWKLPERLFAFDGTFISSDDWAVSAGATQNDELAITGVTSWGARWFHSRQTVNRGVALEGRVKTPSGGGTYCMVGMKNPTAAASYTDFPYALYFNDGALNVYEYGSHRGQFGSYTRGAAYDFRVETLPGAGARYSIRPAGAGAFTLLFQTTSHADARFVVGATIYSGTWGFDDWRYVPALEGMNVTASLDRSGTVELTVTDHAGLTGTAALPIEVVTGSPPVAAIEGPSSADLGVDLVFSGAGSADDFGIAGWLWDFGDGATASGPTVSHFYSSVGTKTVTLTVLDHANQPGTATLEVEVSGENLVQAVPWRILGDFEVPHDVISGKAARLKAVASNARLPASWVWDFGDGSPPASGVASTLAQAYAIEALHVYTGSDGTPFTARISVTDAAGAVAVDTYPVQVRDRTLEVEMNIAIDEGLWYLHRTQNRNNITSAVRGGYWSEGGFVSSATSSSVQAFEINGHLPTGDASRDPYIETVNRGLNFLLTQLASTNIGLQTYGNPDTNGNGIALNEVGSRPIYELGQVIDAFVASGAPAASALAGGTNVIGRPYRDIVQDCMDMYFWGQYDHEIYGGGWRYSWNEFPDNSAAQWGAIGCIPGRDLFGIPIPQWVKDRNLVWLRYSSSSNGFGYTGPGEGHATTPSGMVQLAMDDVPSTDPLWRNAEDYIARGWGGFLASQNFYGFYAFAKAMRLARPEPIAALRLNGFNWFLDPTQGMARRLVDLQRTDGSWTSGAWVSPVLATPWGVIILSSTLFQKPPVAVIHANPNPGAVGQAIRFDASASYHLDPVHRITAFQWDFDAADGIDFDPPDAVGPVVSRAFPALGSYTVTLRVTDDNLPVLADTSQAQVAITIPPHPPTAVPGGPYVAAVGEAIQLDGSASFDIDAGFGDTITAYGWEADDVQPRDFDEATGPKPLLAAFTAPGTYTIGLRVKDSTATVFPQTASPDLTDDAFTEVLIYPRIITDLTARPKDTKIQLVWTPRGGEHFQVFRSETAPHSGFQKIGVTHSTYATFLDQNIQLGKRYFYRLVVFKHNHNHSEVNPLGSSSTVAVTSSPRSIDRNSRPRINTLPGLSAQAGELYSYDVNATDANNDPITYLVEGPEGMAIDVASGLVSWTPAADQLGLHTVFIEARDSKGGADTQIYELLVRPEANASPVAAAGGPYSGEAGSPIAFSSGGSGDPDGDPITFLWSFGDGTTSEQADPIHVYAAAGTYVASLVVRDDRGGVGTAQAQVQVGQPNRPPVAAAGPDRRVRLGEALVVDGSSSSDPDGDPLAYKWEFGDSTPTGTTATAEHLYDAEGVYNASLTVDDGRGGIATDELLVTVGAANALPAIAATGGGAANVDDELLFDATATVDADGDPLTFAWDFGDGSSTSGPLVSHRYGQPGDFEVLLTVRDDHAGVSTAVLAVHINAPPVFVTTPPLSVLEDEPFTYTPAVTDADGDPIDLVLAAAPAGMALVAGTLSWLPGNDDVGPQPVVLRASDGRGRTTEQAFTLAVVGVNDPPRFTSAPRALGIELEAYLYDGEAHDDEGGPLLFSLLEGPAGLTLDPASGVLAWTPALGDRGDHPVRIRVQDPEGDLDEQGFTLTIRAANLKPAFASAPVLVAEEDAPYLYLAEAVDPDGDPVVYALTVAPSGMSISASGEVRWTPGAADAGSRAVTITATDPFGASEAQSFIIAVQAVNDAPVFTTSPVAAADPEVLYAYRARATDEEGDPISFSLDAAPPGMAIDSGSGLLSWTPAEDQAGSHAVAVAADDGRGGRTVQSYALLVADLPHPPRVEGLAPQVAQDPQPFAPIALDGLVSDPDHADAEITWTVSGNTSIAVAIDAGRVATLTYAPGTRAAESITFTAIDPEGLRGEATAVFSVVEPSSDATPPVLVIELGQEAIPLGGSGNVFIRTQDAGGVAAVSLTLDAAPLALVDLGGGLHRAVVPGSAAGIHILRAEVLDRAGNRFADEAEVLVVDPTATGSLTASLTAPAEDAVLTAAADVLGTADGASFLDYVLEIAPQGTSEFREIGGGASPVRGGLLGRIDPGVLENDRWVLRLRVRNLAGQEASAETGFSTDGRAKQGLFRITFNDRVLPLGSFPLSIARTYDSRDKTKGDFGIGWKISLNDARLVENRSPSRGWEQTRAGVFLPTYRLEETLDHTVTVYFGMDERDSFVPKPDPSSQRIVPINFLNSMDYELQGSGSATLTADSSPSIVLPGGEGPSEIFDDELEPYDPSSFTYRNEGYSFTFVEISHRNLRHRLASITDPNGVSITFGPEGLLHSGGKRLGLTRDAEGRVTRLEDPDGTVIRYEYDIRGDLAAVIDGEGHRTEFSYDRRHNLLEIRDPLGNRAARSEYDEAGRLIAIIDAAGRRTEFAHDALSRKETVRDRRGNLIIFEYDEMGNVLARTDPLGARTAFTYDAQGNMLSRTAPGGGRTSFTYDGSGRVLSVTDELGNTTRAEYDTQGRMTRSVGPDGAVVTFAHDFRGNVTSITDALGNVTGLSHDTSGNLLARTDPLGKVTSFTPDGDGNVRSMVDALGGVTRFERDADGNPTRIETPSGGIYRNGWDAEGRLTLLEGAGASRALELDAAGRLVKATHSGGREMRWEFDALGRISATVRSDGSRQETVHDEVGNVIQEKDEMGNVTSHRYDAEDRLVLTTHPDGSTEAFEYDPAGRLIAATDRRGAVTRHEYDLAGRRTAVIDALGGITRFTHDAAGLLLSATDPLGRIVRHEYDLRGRRTRTVFPDGSSARFEHDALGRLVASTDAAGGVLRYEYDALGRLVKVTDAMGGITRYEYDAAGNRTAIIDARGYATRFEHDAGGRITRITYPLGGGDGYSWLSTGGLSTWTSGNGETVRHAYDGLGRLVAIDLPDGSRETYAYTADGLRESVTDARGITRFEYHPQTRRLTRVTEPDGRYVAYEHDAAGNVVLVAHAEGPGRPEEVVLYEYDLLGRLVEVLDPRGGTTRYEYDAAGGLARIALPGGVETLYGRDVLGRITSVVHRRIDDGSVLARFSYTLDALGRRARVEALDGSRVEYDHDASSRVVAERHLDPQGVLVADAGYVHDAVGNILRVTGSLGGRELAYNADDQLVEAGGVAFSYDGAGNLVSADDGTSVVRYGFDARGRLVRFEDGAGAVTSFSYDADGLRVGENGPAGATDYLLDRQSLSGYAQVLRETAPGGSTRRSYTHGLGLLAESVGGSIAYHHADALGSTRLLTDAGGAPAGSFAYSAYGSLLAGSSPAVRHLFAGERRDASTGLYDLRARHYDPANGRFVSRDPMPGDPYRPLTLHRYLYANADPVDVVDPSGLFGVGGVGMSIGLNIAMPSLDMGVYGIGKANPKLIELRRLANLAQGYAKSMVGAVVESFDDLWIPYAFSFDYRAATPANRSLRPVVRRHNFVRKALHRILKKLTGNINYEKGNPGHCADTGSIAYTVNIALSTMYLCPAFAQKQYPIDPPGVSWPISQAGAIVHEAAHLAIPSFDAGEVYGTTSVFATAVANPDFAVRMADSYRIFVLSEYTR